MADSRAQVSQPVATMPGDGEAELQIDTTRKQLRELMFLHETTRVLAATLDMDTVLRTLMAQVREFFRVDAASVALVNDETGELRFRVAVGEAADQVIGLRLAPGEGIAGWVAKTGKLALVPEAHSDPRFFRGADDTTGFYTSAVLAVPILFEGRAIGVIEVLNLPAGRFGEDAQRILSAVADVAAVVIRNAELYERALQAEHRYESVFNESSDPIIVLSMEGRILDLNQCAADMLAHSRQEMIGTEAYRWLGMSSVAFESSLQRLQDGERISLELRFPSDAEESAVLETQMAKIDYGGREAIQWIGHDVSERVALAQMREDLTHMIVHDLRNPLGSIMSSLQLIRTAITEQDETLPVMQLLGISIRSGQKLHRLIDSLLDLARLETGETELSRTPVSPAFLASEASEEVQPLALNKELVLEVNVAANLPKVVVDRDLILRVLVNLLDNALKFTPRGGHVSLDVKHSREGMLFSVSDTGPGIAEEHRQRIFERFMRLSNAVGVKGTGLGLTFCKLAIEAHGGSIWVESEVGIGSSFIFSLPLVWDTTRS